VLLHEPATAYRGLDAERALRAALLHLMTDCLDRHSDDLDLREPPSLDSIRAAIVERTPGLLEAAVHDLNHSAAIRGGPGEHTKTTPLCRLQPYLESAWRKMRTHAGGQAPAADGMLAPVILAVCEFILKLRQADDMERVGHDKCERLQNVLRRRQGWYSAGIGRPPRPEESDSEEALEKTLAQGLDQLCARSTQHPTLRDSTDGDVRVMCGFLLSALCSGRPAAGWLG
jgi:hypothetical protein